MSAWTDYATKYFHEQKKKNPAYQFKDALKVAGPLYQAAKNKDKKSKDKKSKDKNSK